MIRVKKQGEFVVKYDAELALIDDEIMEKALKYPLIFSVQELVRLFLLQRFSRIYELLYGKT